MEPKLNATQQRALIAAGRAPLSTRGVSGRFKVETLRALADAGFVTLESRPRVNDLAFVATITPAGRAVLAELEARRRPRRLPALALAILAGCGVAAEPVGMSDAAVQTELGSAVAVVPRKPCSPNMPDTCLLGRCVADAEGFACVGQKWPIVCKWHVCSVGDPATCETRPGTSGGVCVAVEGPSRGCCLYPSPIQW